MNVAIELVVNVEVYVSVSVMGPREDEEEVVVMLGKKVMVVGMQKAGGTG